jgi:lysozyme family protein
MSLRYAKDAYEKRRACLAACASWDGNCRKRCEDAYQAALNPASTTIIQRPSSKPQTQRPTTSGTSSRPSTQVQDAAMAEQLGEQGLDAELARGSRKTQLSKPVKIAIGIAALAVVGGAIYYFVKRSRS